MMRDDLLALTPEALALFANMGLVKRAQKEVEANILPDLEEVEGLVTARARDGAVTRLAPDVPLKATTCTCGAAMCRHRLVAVLAYQARHGARELEHWDPGTFDEESLVAACGEAAIRRAHTLLEGSLSIKLVRGPSPVARLPTATVQFTVPMKLVFARCDCALGQGCEHVVVAVWAFRQSAYSNGPDSVGHAAQDEVVELGVASAVVSDGVLQDLEAALARVVSRGLLEVGSEVDVATARARAEKAGFLWVVDTFEDLERQRDAWERASATFSVRLVRSLMGELVCRLRAARAGALPASVVLGAGEARETVTDQLRLTPLGVRLRADGERRFAELYLADRDSRQTYVLAREWPSPHGTSAKNGHELGELYVSSRLTLNALVRADLVARAATRKANGHIDLTLARGLKSSTLPGQVGWSELPPPIAIDDVVAYERTLRVSVPAWLGPRRVGAHVHVVRVGRVLDLAYSRGDQVFTALVEDPSGGRLLVKVAHKSVSPGAIDATAQALSMEPRYVSGELSRAAGGLVLEPLGILGTRLTIPDLERPSPKTLPPAELVERPGHLDQVLDELGELVGRGILRGAGAVGPHEALQGRLADVGLVRVGELFSKAGTRGMAAVLLDLLAVLQALDLVR